MATYADALLAIEHLLDRIGETFWRDSIREDLRLWRASRDTSHHLGQYGGMGSFNDVLISRGNNYNVAVGAEPWADTTFRTLRSICYLTAHEPDRSWSPAEIQADLAAVDPGMEAFALGSNVPTKREDRTLFSDSHPRVEVGGLRCRQCGFVESSPEDIDAFLAKSLVPGLLAAALAQNRLVAAVDEVLDVNVPGLAAARESVRRALHEKGVTIQDQRADPNRLRCPRCSREDMVWFAWETRGGPPFALEPAPGNLPMRDGRAPKAGAERPGLWRRVAVWWRRTR